MIHSNVMSCQLAATWHCSRRYVVSWSLQHSWFGLLAYPVYLRCAMRMINHAYHFNRRQTLLSVLVSLSFDL